MKAINITGMVLRVALTVFLIGGIFFETGLFTAISFILIAIALEIMAYWFRTMNDNFKVIKREVEYPEGRLKSICQKGNNDA